MLVSAEGETPMTTLTATRPAAAVVTATRRHTDGLGVRFVSWLLTLDAGYRNAHRLANATDAHLADMGITRSQADAEFARHTGHADRPAPAPW
jgi:uncharacterized protein YjiS (DUF1127 family)